MASVTTVPENPNPAAPPGLNRLIRSLLIVMGGFMLTKGVSLLQFIVIARDFGLGADYEAYAAADYLPTHMVRLIGGGALGVAFIPVLSGLLNQGENEKAWRLASQIFNTLLVVTLCFCVFVLITAPILVEYVIAPGFEGEKAETTTNILRLLSFSTLIFSLSGVLSGALHGHNHFFLPVLAPIFQDLGLLFGVLVFIKPFGIYGLVYGILLGATMHFLIQVPGLVMFKFQWIRELGWRDPQLRHVVRLIIPRMLIGASFLVNIVIINNRLSEIGEGAVGAFSWGIRFMDIPQALLGTAVGIVIFPTLSALSATGQIGERKRAFAGAMRFILATTIPATAGLVMVAYPALRLLFSAWEAAPIFTAIQVLSLAIVVQSLHEVLTRSFYAQEDTFRPLIYSVVATIITVVWIVVAYAIYESQDPPLWSPLAVGSISFGYVLVFLVEVVLLVTALKRRWGDIALDELTTTALKTLLATAVMVIVTLLVDELLKGAGFGDYLSKPRTVIRIAMLVLTGGLSFTAAAWFLRMREIRELPRLIRRRKMDVVAEAA